MDTIALSVETFIAEQQEISIKRVPASKLKESASIPVITVCLEPGSGGRLIADIMHYDLIINTARMDLETAVESVIGTLIGSQAHRTFEKETSYILKNKRV